MKKNQKRKGSPLAFLKKTTLSTLITVLIFLLLKILEPITITAEQVQLPAVDQPLKIYSNEINDNLTDLFVQSIREAKETITLSIFALMDQRVIQELKKKSEEGIPIFIVCDAKASPGISKKIPQAEIIRRSSKGLMHQKILVVDEKLILIGSANLTRESLTLHGNLVFGIEHPDLAKLLVRKIKSMDDAGEFIPLLHQKLTACNQAIEFWALPDDSRAVKRMTELLRSAQKSIKIAMFTWTRHDFAKELIQASQRGVTVEAVIDRNSGKGASSKVVKILNDAGLKVKLSTNQGLLHHKFAIIDDKILINGSANWTRAAFKDNDDCFMVISDLTEEQKKTMKSVWKVIQKNSEVCVD